MKQLEILSLFIKRGHRDDTTKIFNKAMDSWRELLNKDNIEAEEVFNIKINIQKQIEKYEICKDKMSESDKEELICSILMLSVAMMFCKDFRFKKRSKTFRKCIKLVNQSIGKDLFTIEDFI